ncbi:MAG TPA: hypothetical protein VK307_04440 [Thermoleophilaceae bacterium]|nr:hypothetical protein [Thermoleophilaceae bacterium]
MIREAQYDALCAECGAKIAAGEEMDYLPPTGDRPARTSHHPECPEPKAKPTRGVNHGQREDPENVKFIWRTCEGCGSDWAVLRTSLAGRRPGFLGHCCDGRYGWRYCDKLEDQEQHRVAA